MKFSLPSAPAASARSLAPRDSKLARYVSIKVLPASLTRDPDRLLRFEREAQVLASVNHPNIAAIHHVQETADGPALVMELVAGETLADSKQNTR